MSILCTGNTHGQFSRMKEIKKFCNRFETTKNDIMIILGDVGANYYLDKNDQNFKTLMCSCPITFLCIHGNHEERPRNIPSYELIDDERFGRCWREQRYPSILFLDNGEHYINGKRFLVADGAYSVDKEYRLTRGAKWFKSEQMEDYEKELIRDTIAKNNSFDYILTHTVPLNYEPRYLFLSSVNQTKVDKSTEIFLQEIYDSINQHDLKYWLCAHYHDDNLLSEKIRLVYKDIIEIE